MLDRIKTTIDAAVVMVLHLVLAATASVCLKGFDLLWAWLFPDVDPRVMGLFPFRYILEAGEAGITAVFIFFGLIEAVAVMRGKAEEAS